MDLIYMNTDKEDIGVLKDYILDMAFGSDENNFECEVSTSNNVCDSGFYLYAEGTEYGGIIDSINVDTESETVIYKGRTWHGILESKVLEPDAGNDYLVVSGEANTVLTTLIKRMGVGGMFKVSSEKSGVNISSYKMNRYISGYSGILKMLKANGGKLNVTFKNGFVELSAKPFVDYSKDEQFDTDQISFTIQKNYKPINHVICLGQGDLKNRRVIHLYADGVGNISGTQTFTGLDEMCVTYDNSNAESDDELIEGGVEIIKESWASDSIEFDFDSNDESFDVNDVIGAKEFITDTLVSASIAKKIIKIQDYTTSISYSCESTVGTVASSGYPSSGSGGSSTSGITEAQLEDALENAKKEMKEYTDTVAEGKQATITGGASTITSSNLTASRALISNANGKVAVSAVTSTELGYLDGVTSAIQTQLEGKQATISGGASTIASSNLTASRALISNANGKVAVSAVTSTELGYLDGVTSKIQTQLNTLTNKFQHDSVGSSALAVNGTLQIATNALAGKFVVIQANRYSYTGSIVLATDTIKAGNMTNGVTIIGGTDSNGLKYVHVAISASGLITVKSITNWDSVYIKAYGIG